MEIDLQVNEIYTSGGPVEFMAKLSRVSEKNFIYQM